MGSTAWVDPVVKAAAANTEVVSEDATDVASAIDATESEQVESV